MSIRAVWGFAVALAGLSIAALAIAAPVVQSANGPPAGERIYALASGICHQFPTRSLWILDRPMALCARCLAGYLGLALGGLLVIREMRIPHAWLVGTALFLVAVGEPIVQISTSYEGSTSARLISGLLGGIGLFLVLCPLPSSNRLPSPGGT